MRLDKLSLRLALALLAVPHPQSLPTARAALIQEGGEQSVRQEDPQRAIAAIVRELQMDLEGASSTGVLRNIDPAKFDDFPRFQDLVERLTREDTLRVFFRQISNSVKEDSAQTMLDAEMEMTRKDSALPAERRQQQLTIDLERTSRGWKIINLTPKDFFRPL
jgi:hypothetical protein